MSCPLALSDNQVRILQRAAASLPVPQRDAFLQQVAGHLAGDPTDLAISVAINLVFDRMHQLYLCDAENKL